MHEMGEPPRHGHSSIDLQLAVLRQLPTPILVLSPKRTSVFANQAAQRLIGSPNPVQSPGQGIVGYSLLELGIKLCYNRAWNVVLDKMVDDYKRGVEDGDGPLPRGWENDGPVHEADVLVSNPNLKFGERNCRVLMSILTADDCMHYILAFERSAHAEKVSTHSYISVGDRPVSPADSAERLPPKDGEKPPTPTGDKLLRNPAEKARLMAQLKMAVFDSCEVGGFFLSEDEQFYLTNRKLREMLGDAMGGPDGVDGTSLRGRLEIWDEHFTRRLDVSEMPGMRLIRSPRTPFQDYRCGFTHAVTGDRVVINVSGECLYDDSTGDFIGGVCWCRDLQEYSDFVTQQQQRCLESHETICNLMPHMVWTTTPDGMCDWFSERWYGFTGLTPEESLGAGYARAIHTEDLPLILESWERHNKSGTECSSEARYRRHDGVYKWMLIRATPCKDKAGNILKWYGTNTEIHDLVMDRITNQRKRDQVFTVLAHAEVNLFAINQEKQITMSEGGMIWESDGRITNRSELIGQDAIEFARRTQEGGIPEYEKNVREILAGTVGLASSEDVVGNKVYRTRMVAELEHDPLDGAQLPQVKGVLGLSIDITDMKQRAALELDNTRLTMEEQAAKDSNRMKSQFLANMSHEMRTPTAGVIGMVELLSDDQSLSKDQREYVDSIQLSAKALLTIVNDILDFSKIESGRLDIEEVPFSLSTIVGELCKLLTMFAQQKGLEFKYEDTMDENLEVLGDSGRIRQVLSNLLTNALKFTKEGVVSINVSSSVVEASTEGQETVQVQFTIEDTGIGIEKSVLDKLFRPFSQGDSSTARLYGGTGLGLTISRNLANLMHGSIQLESTPGIGSKAIFKVPFKVSSWCPNPAFRAASPPQLEFRHVTNLSKDITWTQPLGHRSINQDLLNKRISSSVSNYAHASKGTNRAAFIDVSANANFSPEQRRKIHVLVVEDNVINQTIAIKNIRKLGFPVTAVWNGREALSYLSSSSPSQPRPDIILMDVQMPVMDGYEATKILRMQGKDGNGDIPVIAMTASAIQGDREKCTDAGMDDYLAKPVEKGRLEEMLVKWAGRKRGGISPVT